MSFIEEYYGLGLTMILLLFAYISFQSYIESRNIHLLHETGFGILTGFLLGLIMTSADYKLQFSGEHFFKILLPPIIFAAGYTLKKRKFFSYLNYIALYAVIGTLVNFFITLLLTQWFQNEGWLVDLNGKQINLNLRDILYFSATMCASDAIAALTLISGTQYPKLFSIVFGEGLLNDAVAIILFDSVGTLVTQEGDMQLETSIVFELLLDFLKNLVISILIGLGVGLIVTYISKVFRSFMEDGIKVNIFLLLAGYASYCLGDLLKVSSVISVLTAGIVMNHYMKYNMNELGRTSTSINVNVIAQISESFLFIYLGISSWTYIGDSSKVSLSFLGLSFIITVVARLGCIYATSGLAYLIFKKSWRVNKYEMCIIWFAGLIRGAVAFALIQTIENEVNIVVVSTILFIVFITTVVLGAVMSTYIQFFIKKMNLNPEILEQEEKYKEEMIQKQRLRSEGKAGKLSALEENFIRPFLIYDYFKRKEGFKSERKLKRFQELHKHDHKEEQPQEKIEVVQFDKSHEHIGSKMLSKSDYIVHSQHPHHQFLQQSSQNTHSQRNGDILHSKEFHLSDHHQPSNEMHNLNEDHHLTIELQKNHSQ